jgi:hypothetical protein
MQSRGGLRSEPNELHIDGTCSLCMRLTTRQSAHREERRRVSYNRRLRHSKIHVTKDKAKQCKAKQSKAMHCDEKQCKAMQSNVKQCTAKQRKAMQSKVKQSNAQQSRA